ncbi:MAG: hypothetical protein ACM3SW_04800 [Actinomycetota bacterium]
MAGRLWSFWRERIESPIRRITKMTFEDEYLALLKKHGIDFDPRFVFD